MKQTRELRLKPADLFQSRPDAESEESLKPRRRERRPIRARSRSQTTLPSSNFTGRRQNKPLLWFPECSAPLREFKSSDSHLRRRWREMRRRRRREEAMEAAGWRSRDNKNANDSKPGRDDKGVEERRQTRGAGEAVREAAHAQLPLPSSPSGFDRAQQNMQVKRAG